MEPIRKARNRTRLVISKPARPAAGSPLKLPGSALALCILSPHSSRRRIAAGAKRCAPIAALLGIGSWLCWGQPHFAFRHRDRHRRQPLAFAGNGQALAVLDAEERAMG